MLAAQSVAFTGTADIRTTSTAASSGSIDVLAGTGAITQSTTSLFTSSGANATARLLAATDVTVGDIVLTSGKVSVTATAGSIRDADALVSGANDADQDVTASALRLFAGTAIGDSVNHLETTVATLSARAGNGSIYLLEADALTVDDVGLSVNRVGSDASTAAVTDAAQSDIRTTGGNGNIVLRTTAGSITLNNGSAPADSTAISANGSGNILIQAIGAGTDITANANVVSTSGSISVSAAGSVLQNANISTTGTIDVRAGADITMADGTLDTSSANIRYVAGATLSVGAFSADNVSLSAQSIVDSGTSDTDVSANQVRLVSTGTGAGQGIGSSSKHLQLNVSKIAGSSAGGAGVFLTEANDIAVGTLGAINVNQVGSDGSTLTPTSDAAQSDLSSAAALVLFSSAGSLSTLAAGGAISAAGNLLLQATGNASDITLGGVVNNTLGNISLNAGRSVLQNANVSATASASTIDVLAGLAITMGLGANLASNNGNILLDAATGNVTLENLAAGSANLAIKAVLGSIVDRDANGDSVVDITGSGLLLKAGTAVGTAANPIETSVGTLTVSAAGGGIYVTESDAIGVNTVSVSVQRVNAQAVATTTPAPALSQADLVTTGANGSIVLLSKAGSITLNDGAGISGTAVSANGSGSVLIDAQGALSDLNVLANVQSTSGAITLRAGHNMSVASGVRIQTLAQVDLLAVVDVTMPDAIIAAGSAPVNITAGGILQPGVVGTSGLATIDTGAGGTVVFNRPVDRLGQNIDVIANRLDIQAGLASVGALLSVASLPAVSPAAPVQIVIGGADSGTGLHLSLTEVNLLQDGFAQITFGDGQVGQTMVVQGVTAAGAAQAVVFKDPLVLDVSGAGSQLAVSGQLQGDSLRVLGAAASTTLADAAISMAGAVTINGLLRVDAASSITAGTTAPANLLITGNIVGVGGPGETLSLRANGGNVSVNGTISNLDGLAVTSAVNVTFDDTVAVTGNLAIDATGIVTFRKSLSLTDTGTLTIRGAGSVVFDNGVVVRTTGDITIDAKMLSLLGGANSLASAGGVLTLTSATTSHDLVLGAGVAVTPVAGALNLSSREITAIGDSFSRVVIGTLGQGALTLIGNTDLTSVIATPIDVRGNTITVSAAGTGSAVQVPDDVRLQSTGNITLNAGLSTAGLNSVTLTSAQGNVAMAGGTRIDSRGGDVQVIAQNAQTVTIASINARSADLTQAGVVDIQAGSGTITDANRDPEVDILARAVNFYGYGPATTSSGDVLEAVADVVQVGAPQGLTVRDSGTDGRAYFNLMNGGKLYQELVVVGAVARVTEDPATLLQKSTAAQTAAGVPVARGNSNWASGYNQSLASNLTVTSYLDSGSSGITGTSLLSLSDLSGTSAGSASGLLSDQSFGLAGRLEQAYILGTPGSQPSVSGLGSFSQNTFEYWVDTLSL